jgi:lysophospholipid acyltransferase (LPLAT)-like uncharacterized protein
MRRLHALIGWLAGLSILLTRATVRLRVVDDPRPGLRDLGRAYIYALPHAHQVSAVLINDDRRMTAMVSRSADGDLLVPALRLRRVTAVRGSSRTRGRDKGGRPALAEMADQLRRGVPGLLAVDGPQGPRGVVRRGVADIAIDTGAPVLPVVVIPSRRWILRRTWDRFQIPQPFSRVRLIFGPPLEPQSFGSRDEFLARITRELELLEETHDPVEAETARVWTREREARVG